jgi:hypothetical protein
MAYSSGADVIEPEHVDAAADRFGRSLLLGISVEAANRLLALRLPKGPGRFVEFTATTELDIDLLLRRLVIEFPGVPSQFALHPTIRPLLRGFRRQS